MASSHVPKGRGRGRPLAQKANPVSDIVPAPALSKTTDEVQTLAISRDRDRRYVQNPEVEVRDQFKSNNRPPKPQKLGTIGQQITLRTNYFPITAFPQKGIVYQYDIQIRNKNHRLVGRDLQRAIYNIWLNSLREKYPGFDRYKIVFDSDKLIFTFDQPLPNIDEMGTSEKIRGLNRFERLEEYDVVIKQVGKPIDLSCLGVLKDFSQTQSDDNIDLNELQSIKQMLSIVLHEYCSSNAEFIFNRSFFSRSLAADRYGSWDLGLGKAIWRGFYSCLVFAKGVNQLLMNLDVSYGVFIKEQSFLDFLCEVMAHSPCGKWRYSNRRNIGKAELKDVLTFFDPNSNRDYYHGEIEFLLKHCRNLSVRSQVTGKTMGYKIDGLGEAAVTQTFFWTVKKTQVTVENYYKEHYGIDLKHPTLPTLKTGNKGFVPMEFVHVQPVKVTKITDEQRAALCMKSSLQPVACFQSIQEVRENPKQQHFEDDPFVAAWNLNITKDMLTIPARILPMPDIICNDRYKVIHKPGDLRGPWNQTKTEFYKPTEFPSVWALINLSASMDRDACKSLYNELKSIANDRGIHCPPPVIYEEYDVQHKSNKEIIDALREMMVHNIDCAFFLVILPEDDRIRDRIYADIKELCELQFGLGIVTQMIKLKKNEGRSPWNYSRLNNILMKVNTKLDGINSIVDVPGNDHIKNFLSRGRGKMYVGVDLSHGPAGSSRGRSTVAVVASVGDIPIRYLKEIYIQDRPPEARGESWEYVVDMKEIMKSLIGQYQEHQGYPPNAIVIYRDGISTSEFDTVFENELTAIREACVELSAVYQPCLTYIVVNKRHHTRFFPTNSDGNVEAGTVVDSADITNPTTYDFFLNSHHVDKKKGTSRPTHYHVLYDDNKLEPDQIQMLTYALCYVYARCASSISIPAPVKYADLLAYRAGIYKNIPDEPIAESAIPINAEVKVDNKIKSRRIVLSPKLKIDCPFFL